MSILNRQRMLGTIVTIGALALAACSDNPVASQPRAAESAPSPLLTGLLSGAGVTITASSTINGVTYETAIVDPRSNVKLEGEGYSINVPSYSICDPLTSGYGVGTWDRSCSVAVLPITFHVKSWTDANGNARTEISPDVRFTPSKLVKIQLKSRVGSQKAGTTINWCPTGSTTCVDEGRTDPSLATQRDASNGTVNRRVKHFSGYMVSVGLTDDSDSTPTDSTQIQ